MKNSNQDKPGHAEDQIKQLQKENNRLQRIIKRHETQLQHLDKMASANEKTNIALYKELEVLQQQAEAQAREAQIEAALERVRARTMGMHKSEELKEVVVVLYKQLDALGLADWGCSIMIFDKEANRIENWVAESSGSELLHCYYVEGQKHPVFKKLWKYWEQQGPPMTLHHTDEVKRELDNYWLNETDFKVLPEEVKSSILNEREIFLSYASMRHGLLSAAGYKRLPNEKIAILERFSKVFEQTYTRFLDLQKAEAQARESQIQLALERVRAKAMSMQNSDELNEVLSVMFEQFDILGIEPKSVHLSLMDIENNRFSFRLTGIKGERNIGEQIIDLNKMPNWAEVVDKWKNSEPHSVIFIEYPPELLPKFWEVFHDSIHSIPERARMRMEDFPDGLFGVGGHNKFGYIGFYHSRRATAEEVNILIRVAREFEGLYQRFLDLQKAEAHAREAVQQASLDRVRAEIASMRTAADLQRITPLIWRELTTLGVPFFRCGVFIIDEATELTHAYLSTPSGEAFAALHMKFDSAPFIHAAVQHWRQQQVYREEWNRAQFIAWTQSILKQGMIDSPEKYQAGGEAPEKLVLHFMPFAQGMLYVGSSAALSNDEIAIGQALAQAFGVAYARYEDFQRLEAAKAQIEAALDNLKKTQGQLVQAEKLASLGQLTAGIAHEIKNPLNFVNNFAALSVDLAKELREEIVKRKTKNGNGDFVDIEEILDMLEQNAEKINHHGKRADGIVHAMMQHARAGKGERQLTDFNKLVEEYVNLSYHGMRAKVPDFNVSIEQDFGELGLEIEMVPQDIGRVLLNLLSNAFDAVREKGQSGDGAYSPSVTVSTRAVGGAVEIRVRDNGGGIPDEVREKIFEPFFTTKPTGSGTGLGLSLSYDIVTQGHGGTLNAESKPGEGATFIVKLPT